MNAARPLAVRLGDFLFRYRNALGPAVFVLALVAARPSDPFGRPELGELFAAAGVVVALLGQALRIFTIGLEYIERGGRDRQVYASRLVQGGVFNHCRNPLYVGNILICAGLALMVHSWAFAVVVVGFVVAAYSCIVAAEEAFLRTRFGAEYDRYCQRVNRWWPRWSGWRESVQGMRFHWGRVLVKEYNTLLLLVLALACVQAWSTYRQGGAAALPPPLHLGAAAVLWLAVYLFARWLKKSGTVRD